MDRFARACPAHGEVLAELEDGSLRCPAEAHQVVAWAVIDLQTGELVAAGSGAAVWLAPAFWSLGAPALPAAA